MKNRWWSRLWPAARAAGLGLVIRKFWHFLKMFVKFRQNFIKISKKNTNFHAFFMKFELNKLFNLFKNDKIVTTFLLKFWDLSGAKVWKSCRSRKSWKNEYLVAIVAVDTAENGPPKVWPNWINYSVVSLMRSATSRWAPGTPDTCKISRTLKKWGFGCYRSCRYSRERTS